MNRNVILMLNLIYFILTIVNIVDTATLESYSNILQIVGTRLKRPVNMFKGARLPCRLVVWVDRSLVKLIKEKCNVLQSLHRGRLHREVLLSPFLEVFKI